MKQLTILKCVNLFDEYSAYTLFTLIYIVLSYRVNNQLLQLGELCSPPRRYLLSHLFIIVLQFADLLQLSNVQVHLLLILLLKSLPIIQHWYMLEQKTRESSKSSTNTLRASYNELVRDASIPRSFPNVHSLRRLPTADQLYILFASSLASEYAVAEQLMPEDDEGASHQLRMN